MKKDAKGQFKVSVVIPCYNHGAFLDEAVDSVLAQTFQDFEIIVVNDGSTEEFTVNLLKNYTKPRTSVVHTTNQGLAAARNNGIKASSGEYVCCLDSDDRYHPEFLAKTVKALDDDRDRKVGFVTTWVQQFGDDTTMWKPFDFDPDRLALMNVGHGCSLFRRECWDRVGGYSIEFRSGYEDWDFWLSLISAGYRWICIAEPLFYYRKKAHSMIQDADAKRIENVKRIFKNHRAFYLDNAESILLKVMEVQEDARKLFVETSAVLAERTAKLTEAYDEMGRERVEHDRELKEKHAEMEAVCAGYDRRIIDLERLAKESHDSYEAMLGEKEALFITKEKLLAEKERQMAALADEHGRKVADIYRQMAEQRAELDGQIEQMNQRMSAVIADFEKRLLEKDNQTAAMAATYEGRLAEKDGQIAGLNGRLNEQGRVLGEKEQQLIERNRLIEGMLQSLSWRITSPLRRIIGLFVSR